jgi:hypothetical protein
MLTFRYGKKNAEYCRIVEEEQGKTSIAETKTRRPESRDPDWSAMFQSFKLQASSDLQDLSMYALDCHRDMILFFVITYF